MGTSNKTHKTKKCEKSSTFKPANAVTKSVPNSGRSSPTSTESTQPEPTTVTPISSSSESTSTTMKPPVASTSHEPSSSIWSQVPWIPFDPEPVITGLKVTTPRVPSSLIVCSMLCERRP